MKKNKLSMRVGSVILSASLMISSVTPAMASNTSTAGDTAPVAETTEAVATKETPETPAAEETPEAPASEEAPEAPASEETPEAPASEETPEAPTSEETPEAPASEETPEAPAAEAPEEVMDEEEIEADNAFNGTPSKVIGVEVSNNYSDTIRLGSKALPFVALSRWNPVYLPGNKTTLNSLKVPGSAITDDTCYTYNGKYYAYGYVNDLSGYIRLSDEITLVNGTTSQYYDATTKLYKINNVYYHTLYSVNNKIGISAGSQAVIIGSYDSYTKADDVLNTLRVKLFDGNLSYDYFVSGNRYFDSYSVNYVSDESGNSKYVLFLYNELATNKTMPHISWNPLSSQNVTTTSNGEALKIGYELEINGKAYTGLNNFATYGNSKLTLCTNSNITLNQILSAGESVSVRVRGVYYYTKEEEKTNEEGDKYMVTSYYVDKVGDWSDAVTYTFNGWKEAATVSGLTAAVYDNNTVKLDWNQVVEANYYNVFEVSSKKPLTSLTKDNFFHFYYKNSEALAAAGLTNADISTDWTGSSYTNCNLSYDKAYSYHYYTVTASSVADGYFANKALSNVASAITTNQAYVPQVKNLRVEQKENGKFDIVFDPISDAQVYIYAYEAKQFPAFYNINQVDPVNVSNGETIRLRDNLSATQKAALRKVYCSGSIDGDVGKWSSDDMSLKTGVTYYFVAHTYDSINSSIDRTAYATVNNVAYTRYNDASAASNVVSAKKTLSKPSVCTSSITGTSIKLGISASNATGYEIYKKSGKKYKKIATTTNVYYVDEDLKENTKYSYRVRSYYYNKDTKVKVYSGYTYITAETSTATHINLILKKKSSKSVTLSWTKVKGATKYEIYRSNIIDCDHSIISKKFDDAGDYTSYLHNHKYELVKSLSAKSKSYTDKKLAAGETYNYIVMAYYKNGKTTQYISAGDYVVMTLETPQNIQSTLKKNSATVTWEKDTYAAKYEIKYTIYDAENTPATKTPQKATTKKTKFTIKNIPTGGYASVSVRAYGKNKEYSDWSATSIVNSLAVTSSIKAVNVVNNNKAAVKISWKKVNGAKYYKVYRSMEEGVYNADEKKYERMGTLISKEANDDENLDSVIYDEYYSVAGSVVGTTTYDYALLDSGVTYYYYVVAFGEKGTRIASYMSENSSRWNYASGKPAKVTYNAALTVTLKNSKKGQVKVSYNKVSGASKYTIYRADKKNGKYTKIGTSKKATFTDKKAKKGKTYYYKVAVTGTNALKADLNVESKATKIKVKK